MSSDEAEEFKKYLEILDICIDRQEHQPIVLPERFIREFTSVKGKKAERMMAMTEFKDCFSTMQYYQYIHTDLFRSKYYCPLPKLPNNVKLAIYDPNAIKLSPNKLTPITRGRITMFEYETVYDTKGSEDIRQLCKSGIVPRDFDALRYRFEEFTEEFTAVFPEYYAKFTPYGSEIYNLQLTNPKRYLNINIELDDPDLDRLVYRKDPYTSDYGEPHCAHTTKLLRINPEVIDKVYNTTRLNISQKTGVEYNFNKSIVTKSTDLISEYLHLDERVRPFLFALKLFVKRKSLEIEMKSYGFMVWGLAYLMYLDPPVIPNLQNLGDSDLNDSCNDDDCLTKRRYWDKVVYNGKYTGAAARFHTCVRPAPNGQPCRYSPIYDPATKKSTWTSSNRTSVYGLLKDFMYFFGNEFSYGRSAISLRCGGITTIKECFLNQTMVIEDPIIAEVNLAAGVNYEVRLSKLFGATFRLLDDGLLFSDMISKNRPTKADINNDYPTSYKSLLKRSESSHVVKCLLLLGLPKGDDCDCQFIEKFFSKYGHIKRMQNLDNETKIVHLNSFPKEHLPVDFEYSKKTIHIVELFNVSR